MVEEKTEPVKAEDVKVVVLPELPQQEVRVGEVDDKQVNLITVSEALTEMYQDVKEIKKAVA